MIVAFNWRLVFTLLTISFLFGSCGSIRPDAPEIVVEENYVISEPPVSQIKIPIKVNYSTWLRGINFATDSEETIKAIIVSNTAEAFEIGD